MSESDISKRNKNFVRISRNIYAVFDAPFFKTAKLFISIIVVTYFIVGSTYAAAETYRVGAYQNNPKIFTKENGEASGIFIDLLNEIAKRESWNLVYIECEWAECLQKLQDGQIDIMPDVAYSKERDQVFDFHPLPVVESWSQIYSDSHVPISRLSDLEGKRVAILRGSIQERVLRQTMDGYGYAVKIIEAQSFDEAFKLVAAGKADAVITNHFFGDYFYQDYGLAKTPIVFNVVPLHYATAQGKNSVLLSVINSYLNIWIKEPNSPYYQTLQKWSEKPDKKKIPKYVFIIAGGVGGLLILLAALILILRAQVRARTEHLEKANEELRKHRENLEELVAERTLENMKIQEQLIRSQKMEAVGELAGGISHNFNNMLAIILGTAEAILKGMGAKDPDRDKVERIIRTGKRAKDITGRLLTFARKESLDISCASLKSIMDDMVEMMKSAIGVNIKIINNAPAEGILVRGDVNLIVQALMNIGINACDAMKNGGTLTLNAGTLNVKEGSSKTRHGLLKSGDYCYISISDTGFGMPESVSRRIFEPFYTTKERGEGTGLGLSVTEGIVKMHDGMIEVESAVGKGTTMKVYLPRVMDHSICDIQLDGATRAQGDGEKILIIDDETDFTTMMTDFMELSGYAPTTANSGEEGVEILKEKYNDIDLVILDIMMPGMDGAKTFDALKYIKNDVKVILCSGHSARGTAADLMSKGALAYVQKPFDAENLLSVISEVIQK